MITRLFFCVNFELIFPSRSITQQILTPYRSRTSMADRRTIKVSALRQFHQKSGFQFVSGWLNYCRFKFFIKAFMNYKKHERF